MSMYGSAMGNRGLSKRLERSRSLAPPESSIGEMIDNGFWIPDHLHKNCMVCDKAFTLVSRRHHCRSCGYLVCSDCSNHTYPLPEHNNKNVRVCKICYSNLLNNHQLLSNRDDPQHMSLLKSPGWMVWLKTFEKHWLRGNWPVDYKKFVDLIATGAFNDESTDDDEKHDSGMAAMSKQLKTVVQNPLIPVESGVLWLKLVEAHGLPEADLLSPPDCYLIYYLTTNDPPFDRVKHSTPVKVDTYRPMWNKEEAMIITNSTGNLVIELWDQDQFDPDDFLGKVTIPISSLHIPPLGKRALGSTSIKLATTHFEKHETEVDRPVTLQSMIDEHTRRHNEEDEKYPAKTPTPAPDPTPVPADPIGRNVTLRGGFIDDWFDVELEEDYADERQGDHGQTFGDSGNSIKGTLTRLRGTTKMVRSTSVGNDALSDGSTKAPVKLMQNYNDMRCQVRLQLKLHLEPMGNFISQFDPVLPPPPPRPKLDTNMLYLELMVLIENVWPAVSFLQSAMSVLFWKSYYFATVVFIVFIYACYHTWLWMFSIQLSLLIYIAYSYVTQTALQTERAKRRTDLNVMPPLHWLCTFLGVIPCLFLEFRAGDKKETEDEPQPAEESGNKSSDDEMADRNQTKSSTDLHQTKKEKYESLGSFARRMGNQVVKVGGLKETLWWCQDLLIQCNSLIETLSDLFNWANPFTTSIIVLILCVLIVYSYYGSPRSLVLLYGGLILAYFSKPFQFILWCIYGFINWIFYFQKQRALAHELLLSLERDTNTSDFIHELVGTVTWRESIQEMIQQLGIDPCVNCWKNLVSVSCGVCHPYVDWVRRKLCRKDPNLDLTLSMSDLKHGQQLEVSPTHRPLQPQQQPLSQSVDDMKQSEQQFRRRQSLDRTKKGAKLSSSMMADISQSMPAPHVESKFTDRSLWHGKDSKSRLSSSIGRRFSFRKNRAPEPTSADEVKANENGDIPTENYLEWEKQATMSITGVMEQIRERRRVRQKKVKQTFSALSGWASSKKQSKQRD